MTVTTMGSMSVHSLIDKFTASDETPPVPRSRSGPPVLELDKARTFLLERVPPAQVPQPRETPPTKEFKADPALLALLGPDIDKFPHSEPAFVEALRLRAEQERTKQEQIRLELATKNLAIIQAAIQHDVPPHMIPPMCVGPIPLDALPQGAALSQHLPAHPQFGHRPYPSGDYALAAGVMMPTAPGVPGIRVHSSALMHPGAPGHPGPLGQPGHPGHSGHPGQPGQHSASPSISGAGNPPQPSPFLAPSPSFTRSYDSHDNASTVAPINYRFGTGPKVPPPPAQRRPLSPAKIGAAAVANLANPTTPYRPSHRTLPTHQRHFSMPAETLSPQRVDRNSKTRNLQNFQLQSPLGATSSIQVRPSPAQPLNKQTRNSQIPSQESMTSFQHVIQFHHWKPEGPGDREGIERGSISSESLTRGLFSHKRHKSNDMSIDLLLVPQEAYLHQRTSSQASVKREYENHDVSMDSSDITITEPKDTPAATSDSSLIGKFPHDILLRSR